MPGVVEANGEVRFEEVAVSDVVFAVALEPYDVLAGILTEVDDCSSFSPTL